MAQTVTGSGARLSITIDGGSDIGPYVQMFEWTSFMNGGYVIYARFIDPFFSQFQANTDNSYLQDARKKPLEVKFQLIYTEGDGVDPSQTDERTAYMTDLRAKTTDGQQAMGMFEFIAIDPPSWYLNKGDGKGTIYTGKISDVIQAVVNKYAPGIDIDISTTKDNGQGRWQQMRMDPKTFIQSMLDWSASITNQQTNWIVASVDTKIIIKEQAELQNTDFGSYSIDTNQPAGQDIVNWEVLESNYLSNLQTQLKTSGISATCGLYCDYANPTTKDTTIVNDQNTGNKQNVSIQSDQGFSKPTDTELGITYIRSIPEHSAGDVGVQYSKYIDGRARGMYLGMLGMLFKMRLRVYGNAKVSDSSQLGVATINLSWNDNMDNPHTFNGPWLVYGFKHIYTRDRMWYTDLYISRLDYNATAQDV